MISDHLWQISILASSSLASILAIVLFIKYPCTRAHPGPVLLSLFLSSGLSDIFSMSLLLTLEPMDEENPGFQSVSTDVICGIYDSNSLDQALFWSAVFFITATPLWYLMMSLDLVYSMLNPFLPFRSNSIAHHCFVWPATSVWVAIIRYGYSKRICSEFPVAIFMKIPQYIILIVNIIILIHTQRKSGYLEIHTHQSTKRMAKRIIPYLIVNGCVCIIYTVAYIIQHIRGREDHHITSSIIEISAAIESVVIFSLFCIESQVLREVIVDMSKCNSVEREESQDLDETVAYSIDLESLNSDEQSNTSTNSPGRIESIEDRNAMEKGTDNLPELLRMDIMRYTANGILNSSRNAVKLLQERTSGSRRHLTYSDYVCVEESGVFVQGINNNVILSFHDCAPLVFLDIRKESGITPEKYHESFDIENIFSEHGSEGKSGNMFYFTANGMFMVKTVPKDEYETLLSILPFYYKYLKSNPNTLICKYYGCHSISLPVGTRRMYLVVMQNLFAGTTIHQRFDLKGNTDRRQAIRSREIIPYIYRAKNHRSIRRLMLDIDFLTLHRGLALNPSVSEQLESQLVDDVTFLASRGIMDYSLLIGVHCRSSSCRTDSYSIQSRFYRSIDGKREYYLGVVDILQIYNWKWTLQRWFLGYVACKDIHNISAVPPLEYARRLATFVEDRLFTQPEEDEKVKLSQSIQTSETEIQNLSLYSTQFTSTNFCSTPTNDIAGLTVYRNESTPRQQSESERSFFI